MKPSSRKTLLVLALIGIVTAILYLEIQKVRPGKAPVVAQCTTGLEGACAAIASTTDLMAAKDQVVSTQPLEEPVLEEIARKSKEYERYVEIANPSGFINTEGKPLAIKDLVGKKVVLVDFWTYSCINCQRTLPYLTSWYKKYGDLGLEIVSIHTPEFEFDKKYENVIEAAKRFNITYPIVQDNDYATWRAYKNFYWPRKYLIDIDGFIVYDHIGEGAYAETEKKIQELLSERDKRLGTKNITDQSVVTPETAEAVDSSKPRTPEIYFGAWRNDYLGNGVKKTVGSQTLALPFVSLTHALYLDGTWKIESEYAENVSGNAKIQIRYQAQKVFLVAGADSPVLIKILLDGKLLPKELRGIDVAEDGSIKVKEEGLYRLVEGEMWGEHTLELIIESPGLRVFTFTFG